MQEAHAVLLSAHESFTQSGHIMAFFKLAATYKHLTIKMPDCTQDRH